MFKICILAKQCVIIQKKKEEKDVFSYFLFGLFTCNIHTMSLKYWIIFLLENVFSNSFLWEHIFQIFLF